MARLVHTLSRARRLASGQHVLASGLVVMALAGFAYMAIVGRRLGPDGAEPIMVLWALTNALGAGIFVPVEQDLARRVSRARVQGAGTAGLVRRTAVVAGAGVLVVTAATLLAFDTLTRNLFGGHPVLTAMVPLVAAAFAAQHLTRGVLAGTDRFATYGAQLLMDAGLRAAGALVLVALGVGSIGAYAAVLVLAPALSLVVPGASILGRPGSAPALPGIVRSVGLTAIGQGSSVAIMSAGPVLAGPLSGAGSASGTAVLVGTFVVARALLLPLYAVQAVLVPHLARLQATGQHREASRRAALTAAAVAATGLGVTALSPILGPTTVRLFLGEDYRATPGLVTMVAGATMAYVLACVATLSLLALGHHHRYALSWVAAALTYAACVVVLGPPPSSTLALALATGSGVAALTAGWWMLGLGAPERASTGHQRP